MSIPSFKWLGISFWGHRLIIHRSSCDTVSFLSTHKLSVTKSLRTYISDLFKKKLLLLTSQTYLFQPQDWDDEEDGEWVAPTIPNPEYKGPWEPKVGLWCFFFTLVHDISIITLLFLLEDFKHYFCSFQKIKNPNYKGKWKAPLIDNPGCFLLMLSNLSCVSTIISSAYYLCCWFTSSLCRL